MWLPVLISAVVGLALAGCLATRAGYESAPYQVVRASGKFEVVHSAVDNALAMIETAHVDVVIVSGGDGGTNEFIVGKDIKSFADIRGKALVTDAPNTAYAVQAKKILLRNGLKEGVDYRINAVGAGPFRLKAMLEGGDNAAAIMNLPFSAQVIEAGLKSMGRTVDMLGPYQAGGAFVLRSWAKANPETLERYIAGYIESLRWVVDKSHREEAIALLMSKRNLSRSPGIPPCPRRPKTSSKRP